MRYHPAMVEMVRRVFVVVALAGAAHAAFTVRADAPAATVTAASRSGAVKVRASLATAPCLRSALEAYAASEVAVDVGDVRGARGFDVLVGSAPEVDRALEGGEALIDTDVELARIPWVLVSSSGAASLDALARTGAAVTLPAGPESYEARRALSGFARERVRETRDAGVLRAATAALVPLSLAGPGPRRAVDVYPILAKAAVTKGAAREAAARELVAYLGSDAGTRAFAACATASAPAAH